MDVQQAHLAATSTLLETVSNLIVYLADQGHEEGLNKAGVNVKAVRGFTDTMRRMEVDPEFAKEQEALTAREFGLDKPKHEYTGGQYL